MTNQELINRIVKWNKSNEAEIISVNENTVVTRDEEYTYTTTVSNRKEDDGFIIDFDYPDVEEAFECHFCSPYSESTIVFPNHLVVEKKE